MAKVNINGNHIEIQTAIAGDFKQTINNVYLMLGAFSGIENEQIQGFIQEAIKLLEEAEVDAKKTGQETVKVNLERSFFELYRRAQQKHGTEVIDGVLEWLGPVLKKYDGIEPFYYPYGKVCRELVREFANSPLLKTIFTSAHFVGEDAETRQAAKWGIYLKTLSAHYPQDNVHTAPDGYYLSYSGNLGYRVETEIHLVYSGRIRYPGSLWEKIKGIWQSETILPDEHFKMALDEFRSEAKTVTFIPQRIGNLLKIKYELNLKRFSIFFLSFITDIMSIIAEAVAFKKEEQKRLDGFTQPFIK